MANKKDLRTLVSKSWTGSNMLDIQIIQDCDPDLPFYKEKIFAFVGFVPGTVVNGNRTYDMKNKLVMKLDLFRLSSLAKSIDLIARTKDKDDIKQVQYTIFTDSGTKKILTPVIWEKEGKEYFILGIQAGDVTSRYMCHRVEAMTLSEEIEEMVKFGRAKEAEIKMADRENYRGKIGNTDPAGAKATQTNKKSSPQQESFDFNDIPSVTEDDLPF